MHLCITSSIIEESYTPDFLQVGSKVESQVCELYQKECTRKQLYIFRSSRCKCGDSKHSPRFTITIQLYGNAVAAATIVPLTVHFPRRSGRPVLAFEICAFAVNKQVASSGIGELLLSCLRHMNHRFAKDLGMEGTMLACVPPDQFRKSWWCNPTSGFDYQIASSLVNENVNTQNLSDEYNKLDIRQYRNLLCHTQSELHMFYDHADKSGNTIMWLSQVDKTSDVHSIEYHVQDILHRLKEDEITDLVVTMQKMEIIPMRTASEFVLQSHRMRLKNDKNRYVCFDASSQITGQSGKKLATDEEDDISYWDECESPRKEDDEKTQSPCRRTVSMPLPTRSARSNKIGSPSGVSERSHSYSDRHRRMSPCSPRANATPATESAKTASSANPKLYARKSVSSKVARIQSSVEGIGRQPRSETVSSNLATNKPCTFDGATNIGRNDHGKNGMSKENPFLTKIIKVSPKKMDNETHEKVKLDKTINTVTKQTKLVISSVIPEKEELKKEENRRKEESNKIRNKFKILIEEKLSDLSKICLEPEKDWHDDISSWELYYFNQYGNNSSEYKNHMDVEVKRICFQADASKAQLSYGTPERALEGFVIYDKITNELKSPGSEQFQEINVKGSDSKICQFNVNTEIGKTRNSFVKKIAENLTGLAELCDIKLDENRISSWEAAYFNRYPEISKYKDRLGAEVKRMCSQVESARKFLTYGTPEMAMNGLRIYSEMIRTLDSATAHTDVDSNSQNVNRNTYEGVGESNDETITSKRKKTISKKSARINSRTISKKSGPKIYTVPKADADTSQQNVETKTQTSRFSEEDRKYFESRMKSIEENIRRKNRQRLWDPWVPEHAHNLWAPENANVTPEDFVEGTITGIENSAEIDKFRHPDWIYRLLKRDLKEILSSDAESDISID
mmetsp:Transcript_16344/g.19493  ORF Transcript_16344/g.19493 Transcript_16344/m.19493 type:complete len:910 (+) Transcript_16344:139-2868(+)